MTIKNNYIVILLPIIPSSKLSLVLDLADRALVAFDLASFGLAVE